MVGPQRNLFVDEDTSDPSFNPGNEEELSTDYEDEISTEFTEMNSDSDLLEMLCEEIPHTENRTNTAVNSVSRDSSINHIPNIIPRTNIESSTAHTEFKNGHDDNLIIIPTQEPSFINKNDNTILNNNNNAATTIDLDAEEQQVIEILDDEEDDLELKKSKKPPESYKPIREYKCPICFESPENALMTQCGHVFCCDCLFQMVNNSNPSRNLQNSYLGLCALCRSKVDLRTVVLLRMKCKKNRLSGKTNK